MAWPTFVSSNFPLHIKHPHSQGEEDRGSRLFVFQAPQTGSPGALGLGAPGRAVLRWVVCFPHLLAYLCLVIRKREEISSVLRSSKIWGAVAGVKGQRSQLLPKTPFEATEIYSGETDKQGDCLPLPATWWVL